MKFNGCYRTKVNSTIFGIPILTAYVFKIFDIIVVRMGIENTSDLTVNPLHL